MRLLLLNYEYPPLGGGASNATWFIARELSRNGHATSVLSSAYQGLCGFAEEDGVRVYRVRTLRRSEDRSNPVEMGSFTISALLSARRIASAEGAEGCISFFTIPSGPVALSLKRRLGIPYVVSLRGGDVPGHVPELGSIHLLSAPLRRAVLREAAAIAANSRSLAELSMTTDPFPVQTIPNGVDTEFYAPDPAQEQTTNGAFRFLFVGRFQEGKNLSFLLDALGEAAKCVRRDFVLEMVGDGPLKEKLLERAQVNGLSDRVRVRGWMSKDQLRNLYPGADCFLNPSLYEGMPNTVLEAMACSLPVIASDIGGHRDLVVHGSTGLLFPLRRQSELVRALVMLVDSPGLARAMGSAGRARAVAEFSWRQVAGRYAEILQAAVAHRAQVS